MPAKKIFTDEQLKTFSDMAEAGCTMIEIANFLECNPCTLSRRKPLRDVMEKAGAILNCKLRKAQIKSALDGNPTILKFLGINRLGQKESVESKVEISGIKSSDIRELLYKEPPAG